MRKLAGVLVFAGGLAGLTYWAAVDHAESMQAQISEAAQRAARGSVHDVQVRVSGRDIVASGLAEDAEEKVALLKALNAVEGRRVVRGEIRVIDRAAPYSTALVKTSRGIEAEGFVPRAALHGKLNALGALGTDNLKIASGAPEGWDAAMQAGYQALAQLDDGRFALDGDVLALSAARAQACL